MDDKIIVALLSKEKRKAPYNQYYDKRLNNIVGRCPLCNEWSSRLSRYCKMCGQHLNWDTKETEVLLNQWGYKINEHK